MNGPDAPLNAILRQVVASTHPVPTIAIDGPSGAGKTTFAVRVEEMLREIGRTPVVVPMDACLRGWDGLEDAAQIAAPVIASLRAGRDAAFRPWDWERDQPGERRIFRAGDVVVLEGVGSGRRAWAAEIDCLVWVDLSTGQQAPVERAIRRDGPGARDALLRWQRLESDHFTREDTERRADLRVLDLGLSPTLD